MNHETSSLLAEPESPPAHPPRRRRRRRPGPRLHEAQVVRAFRRMLARRGAGDLDVHRAMSYEAGLFTCAPCFDAALARLGWTATREEPDLGEEGLAEPYRRVAWRFEAAEGASARSASFFADRLIGLWRIRPDDGDDVWLWTHKEEHADAACLAFRSRERLRPLLDALHAEIREHKRRTGLVFVGSRGDEGPRRRFTWDSVVLPPALREEVRATVKEFFAAAPLYRAHGVPHRRGLLLTGPPGNGKTSIIRAIASEVDVPVVIAKVDPKDLDETREAFDEAADLAPAVLCFEDLDGLVAEGRGRSQFLNLLDGLVPLDGVLVVATTNHPDRIDPAITRRPSRFDRVFVIPEPEAAQRREYLARELRDQVDDDTLARVVDETAGYSMAFLKELVLQARLSAVRRGAERLAPDDVQAALEATREHLRLADRGLDDRTLGF